MSLEKMSTQEWIEYTDREIARMQWLVAARAFGTSLLQRERELEQATAERDAAREERQKIIAATEGRKVVDAKAADRARTELAAMLADVQATADRDLARARVELSRIHDQTTQAHAARALAEGQRDALREDAKREAAEITARLEALRAEEQAFRGRLTAALKV